MKRGSRRALQGLLMGGVVFAGLLGGAGCRWKMKPTYEAKTAAKALKNLCAKDYHLKVQTRLAGRSLQAVYSRLGLLRGGEDIREEAALALDRVMLCAARVALSTDAPLEFIEIRMRDILSGSTVTLWRYVPDLKDSIYTRISSEEYLNRLVIEIKPPVPSGGEKGKKGSGAGAGLWEPPISFPTFLAKQVALRARRQTPIPFEAKGEVLAPQTLSVVIERWGNLPAEEIVKRRQEVADAVEKASRDVVRAYKFQGFRDAVLRDSGGSPLRAWRF